jgi:multiple antibiotic resistance protein
MANTFLLPFIPLFVAFDVFGILPIYLKFTSVLDFRTRNRHLRDSLLTSFITALIFVIVGNQVMTYLGISMNDFLMAGGIVIFITALKEIVSELSEPAAADEMFGVVPLGIPFLPDRLCWQRRLLFGMYMNITTSLPCFSSTSLSAVSY